MKQSDRFLKFVTLLITLSALQLDNDGEFIDVDAIEEAINANCLFKLKHMMLEMPVESRRRMCLGNHQVSNSHSCSS